MTSTTPATALRRLQEWYHAQCNGDWEHTHGVTIATLDNPGWTLDVDLLETVLAERPFLEVKRGYEDGADWLICFVREQKFMGRCGPQKLEELIEIFLSWAEAS